MRSALFLAVALICAPWTIQDRYGGKLIDLERVSWHTPGLAIWQSMPGFLIEWLVVRLCQDD